MKSIVYLLLIGLGLSGINCKKRLIKKIDIQHYYDCHQAQNLDSLGLSKKILGTWKWNKISCLEVHEKGRRADKDVVVKFTSDGNYILKEESKTIAQGKWSLVIVDRMLGLALEQPSNYLQGKVLVCEDEILFHGSYIDVCDHLFKREN